MTRKVVSGWWGVLLALPPWILALSMLLGACSDPLAPVPAPEPPILHAQPEWPLLADSGKDG